MLSGLGRFRDSSALAGWLFADFMLALGMLFIIANTVGTRASPDSPTVTGFTPTSGPVHTRVRIAGSNFKDVKEIHFGKGLAVQPQVDSETQISVEVPSDATSDLITVITANGIGTSPGPFTVLTPTLTPTPVPMPSSTPTLAATAAPTPEPTISSTPTPKPCETTRDYQLQTLIVPAGPNGGAPTRDVLLEAFAPYAGQSAGLVIVYGQSTTPGEGEQLANGAYAALRSYLPDIFTDKTIVKPQHDLSGNSHQIEFDVLFFASRCDQAA
jgi:hypothetical protein